ncbi:hypothetical protein KA344_10370 [bacterium]|nr:hypothetical protein [bacterium]
MPKPLTVTSFSLSLTLGVALVLPAIAAPDASNSAKKSASSTPAPTSLSTSIYAQGVQAYQAGRYNEAAAYMNDSIAKEKAGANAWLYVAHSYYALGQRKRAEETYQKLKDNFAGTPQAALAEQYLLRLNSNAKKDSASANRANSNSSSAANSDSSAVANDAIAGTKDGMKQLRKRVSIVRPVYGHDPVTEKTIRAVDACFDKIPPIVQEILYKGEIQFVITPTMIDKFPAGAYQEVAGYEGGTSKSCPGLFTGRTVVLSQATIDEGSNLVRSPRDADDLQGTFLHETGHAVDACLHWYSCTDEFRHNYYLDIARVPDDVAPKIRYYLQKSVRGQKETCAELTSILLGNQRGNYQEMITYFPNTMKYIKGKLGL